METFKELLGKVGVGGSMASTPYDTAWIARFNRG